MLNHFDRLRDRTVRLSDFDRLRDHPMIKFKTEMVEGVSYTIISYMIADKDFWRDPLCLETRGITFETETGQCVCRPFAKFFNVGERADTQPEIVERDLLEVYEKRDGSMLTPILTKSGQVWFKTKKSFYSDVATTANSSIPESVAEMTKICIGVYNATPIFEFAHPDHRIVLDYPPDKRWTLLAIRDNDSGEHFSYDTLKQFSENFGVGLIPRLQMRWNDIVKSIEEDKGIEGYVVLLKDGRRAKCKTAWYLSLHRTMTELRVRDVAEMVVEEAVDDLKSLVVSQGKDIGPIEEIEKKVCEELNLLRESVESLAREFDGKPCKDVALALSGHPLFSLVMSEIRTKAPRYADHWKRNYLRSYPLRVLYNPSFSSVDS